MDKLTKEIEDEKNDEDQIIEQQKKFYISKSTKPDGHRYLIKEFLPTFVQNLEKYEIF